MEASSTIFWVFGMTQPGIEPRSPSSLANTLPTRPMNPLAWTPSRAPPHMDEQRQDDPLESTYNSSDPIQDVALKTYQKWWTIDKGGGRESGRSVLMARHDEGGVLVV